MEHDSKKQVPDLDLGTTELNPRSAVYWLSDHSKIFALSNSQFDYLFAEDKLSELVVW